MQKITDSKKLPTGIEVTSFYADEEVSEFFTYEELVDQKINALDLLKNPGLYEVDTIQHTIESSV